MMVTVAAMLFIKAMFSGVVALVPSAKDPHLIRVVAPNARVPDTRESDLHIPAHVTYLMFRLPDLASNDPEKSRQPDFVINKGSERVGIFLIKGEYLQAGAFSDANAADIKDELPKEMFTCCRDIPDENDVPLDTALLAKMPDPDRVGLRLDLTHGVIGNEKASIDSESSNIVKADGSCRPLTRLVCATLPSVGEVAELRITSTPFKGSVQQRPILLARKASAGDLRILIGNEPLADIPITADFLLRPDMEQPGHHSSMDPGADQHMHILHELTQGQTDVLTPEQIPVAECDSNGMHKPPSSGDHGKPDGCNPTGMPASDPSDFRFHKRIGKD